MKELGGKVFARHMIWITIATWGPGWGMMLYAIHSPDHSDGVWMGIGTIWSMGWFAGLFWAQQRGFEADDRAEETKR